MQHLPLLPVGRPATGRRHPACRRPLAVASLPSKPGSRRVRQLVFITCVLAAAFVSEAGVGAAQLSVPPTQTTVPMAIAATANAGKPLALVDVRRAEVAVPVDFAPRPDARGRVAVGEPALVGTLPARRWRQQPRVLDLRAATEPEQARPSRFRFSPLNDNSLLLWEGADRVLVYNHGMILPEGVPADRRRSSYVHPVYGLDGEVLTDDFPEDHYHHRGLFWAWPHVRIGDQHYDLWMISGVEQRFERWLARDTAATAATLAVENGWYIGERKVVEERIWLRAYPAGDGSRCIDVEGYWIPVDEAIELAGAAGKSYGGLTLRYAPRTDTVITTPLGNGAEDLAMQPLAWADLSARFAGRSAFSGAALFVGDDHPDYPPTWLTRHYGALCIGWPGVKARTFPAGEPIRCRYRMWVHRDAPDQETIQQAYDAYRVGLNLKWTRE